ncbi:MAG: tRNA (adenosine(37)-N6)-dimethylallyltransferase MiaA [Xanthomonadales bacterium]|nr:tRNA (adenosine(37)-N6)-dimethylallyltransferase MiaA [Xanthomonadales bacterium]
MKRTMTKQLPPVIFLMGATATGKTGLAIELAEQFLVDIISVDSAMVYRGMDIGSAKPEAEVLAQAAHALVDIRDPEAAYSAANFCTDALKLMQKSWAAKRIPLLVGGTTLYFKALEYGLSPLPDADPLIRKAIDAKAEQLGWPALHAQLQQLDPEAAARIKVNDRQRIQRALEVCEITGVSMTSLQQIKPPGLQANILKLVLTVSNRRILHQRIETRFEQMLAAGLLDEIKALMARPGVEKNSTAMRSVGYRQGWEYLEAQHAGECEDVLFPQFRHAVISATRQLAKRQLTGLRQMPLCLWYDCSQEDRCSQEEGSSSHVIKDVERFLEISN